MNCLKKLTFLIVIVFLFSCTNQTLSSNTESTIITDSTISILYANGKKTTVPYKIISGDTILSGVGITYYPNGIVQDSIEYKENKKNGFHTHFDSTGKIFSKIYFKNNAEDGEGYFFKPSGDIDLIGLYANGRLILNKWLYKNGKVALYNAMDNDSLIYAVTFDSLGNKIEESGSVFSNNIIINYPKDKIPKDKIIEFKIPIAVIPEYSITIEVVKINNIGKVVNLDDNLPIENYYSIYKTKFSELGKQTIGIAGALLDDKGRVLKRDTITTSINVVK